MPPTSVVFDVGNVLYRWDPKFLFEKLIPDSGERTRFLAEIVTLEWHEQHDVGRPLAGMVAERCRQFPDSAPLIEAYVDRWLETIPGPVPGVLELVERLDSRGVPLYAITNFGTEFWARFRPTAPVLARFRDIIVSGEERLVKPDPEIFRRARDRFGLVEGDGLFIDDRAENVEAAEAQGFAVHHFRDAETLEAELGRLGIL